jgi:pyridoxal phosphate enzyme (YggS family)
MSKLLEVLKDIRQCTCQMDRKPESLQLLAVTKNQPSTAIRELINQGHRLFGENRVQEAYQKWPALKEEFPDVKLHLIGHLQTNKVKDAIALFDAIQTLDNFKLAEKLVSEEYKQRKKLKYFIEINIGEEPQKYGVWPNDFPAFLQKMQEYYPLSISGIMCIPPKDQDPTPYFQKMHAIYLAYPFSHLSMGMSEDYPLAIKYGSTLLRLGRALFS